jgi:hypothetical protein
MFQTTIVLFDRYCRYLDTQGIPQFNRDLSYEVKDRLKQLDYIVTKVKELENTATATHLRFDAERKAHIEDLRRRGIAYEAEPWFPFTQPTTEELEAEGRAMFEMELLTETFYYFAGRVRTILRNPQAPIPGLKGFECEGVRNTRNKLLEHAEGKDSQVSIRSFGCGGSQGPVLKAVRLVDQTEVFPDKGLYKNAEEFRSNLDRLLEAELAKS